MKYIFKPHPGKQTEFMTRPEFIVGFGGSAGSGKTMGLRNHFCYLLDFEEQRYKRNEIRSSTGWVTYFRRVMPNQRQNIAIALREFPMIDAGVKYNATESTFKFDCGLHYQFGAMEKPHDWMKYYGTEQTALMFDELTEFDEEQFDQLETRVRSPDPALKPFLNIRWASNPVGPGLMWVRKRFVEPAPPGTTVRRAIKIADGRTINIDQVFIQAYLRDNPTLAADGIYEANLRKNKPHIFRQLFLGDWYSASDGLFSHLWNQEAHVCENHRIPPNVFRFRSGDFGINEPSSISWWYVDRDGCLTCYYHLYMKGLTADKQAARIEAVERHHDDWDIDEKRSMLRRSPLDAQCFKRTGTSGPSIAQEFIDNGVMWIPSTKDRFNGMAEIAKRLSKFIVNKETGERKPMIRWMKKCEMPIKLLPILPRDPNNPEDLAPRCEDHVADDLMYCVTSQPLKPKLELVRDPYDDDEADEDRPRGDRLKRGYAHIG